MPASLIPFTKVRGCKLYLNLPIQAPIAIAVPVDELSPYAVHEHGLEKDDWGDSVPL